MDDSLFGLSDPGSMALLGALSGMAPYLGASRLPTTFAQGLSGAAGGMLGGIQAGQSFQKGQQEITGESLKNVMALDAMRRQAAALGQAPPSLEDIRSGKYQGLNWTDIFGEMMKQWQGQQSAAPQIPQPSAGGQIPVPGPTNLSSRLGQGAVQGSVTSTLTNLGYSPSDQAAVLGNAAWESSLNPKNTSGDQGTSMGLWQWHSPDRKAGLMQYAQATGRDWSDPSVQAEYMDRELRQRAPEFFDPNKSIAEKTKIFQDKFEVPAADTSKQRTQLAQNFAGVSDIPPGGGQAVGGMGMSPIDAFRQQALASTLGGKIPEPLNDYFQAMMLPPGPARDLALSAAQTKAGMKPFIGGERRGAPIFRFNPQTNNYDLVVQNPQLPEGAIENPNGTISMAPGALPAIAGVSGAQAQGKAQYQPQTGVIPEGQPGAGTPYVVPRAQALAPGAPPLITGLSPGAKEMQVAGAKYGAEYGNLIPGGALPGGMPQQGGAPAPGGNLIPGGAVPGPGRGVQAGRDRVDRQRRRPGDLHPHHLVPPADP